jgi:hypothetical protein
MALKVAIQESKNVSAWKDYKDAETGKVLAKFKIRGANYQAYLVGLERAQNQIASKGYNVSMATGEDKLWHDLLMEAAGCHLIEDWQDVVFLEKGKEVEVSYSAENATKLLSMGKTGMQIWNFIKAQAVLIQIEADKLEAETLGKSSNSTDGTPETVD